MKTKIRKQEEGVICSHCGKSYIAKVSLPVEIEENLGIAIETKLVCPHCAQSESLTYRYGSPHIPYKQAGEIEEVKE